MKKYILSSIILLLAAANTAWGQNVATVTSASTNTTTGYDKLSSALSAAQNNDIITLEANIDYINVGSSSFPIIISNKSVTIDFNGHSIKMSISTGNDNVFKLIGNSNVVFKDESTGSTKGSIIDQTGTTAGIYMQENTHLTVSDITISGSKYAIYPKDNSQITITSGTFEGSLYALRLLGKSSATISGGTFNSPIDKAYNALGFTISGGIFSNSFDENWVAPGYYKTTTDVGGVTKYTVAPCPVSITNANNETTYYQTLQAAINAAQAGETIKLLNDITVTSSTTILKSVTIDFNGCTITATDGVSVTVFQLGTSSSAYDIVFKDGSTGDKGGIACYSGGTAGIIVSGNNHLTVSDITISNASTDIAAQDNSVVTITGGTFNSSVSNIDKRESATVSISGGIFSQPVQSEWCAEGYGPVDNGNGTYGVRAVSVAKIVNGSTTTYYPTLQAAVEAANAGETIKVIVAGEYTLPNLPKNITIEGTVDGVVFNHTTAGSVASIPNGATFKNVTFNFGNVNYHGFQHAGTINMEGCTLNGKLFCYGDMNFTDCSFNQSNSDYHMWAYSGNLTYTGCTFTNTVTGKFINVYNESGTTKYTVTTTNCTFVNQGSSNKAALNVKATSGSNLLTYDVIINNCTTEGAFPEASASNALVVLNSVVQVDDRTASGVDNITVTQDGVLIYPAAVAKIGDTNYVSLAAAVAAAQAGDVITMIADDNVSLTAAGSEVTIDKPLTITGAVDESGKPKYTIFGSTSGALSNSSFNDLFLSCSTGTVTISNLKFDGFGNEVSSVMGHSPVFIGSRNQNAVIENVYISNLNCEGIHINGGTFTINNCNIDCSKTTNSIFTKGICVVNDAEGTIENTTITGVDCDNSDDTSAAIELQGSGDIAISGCTIQTETIGIANTPVQDLTAGTSQVTISDCTITSQNIAVYSNGEKGALTSITSGRYSGLLMAGDNDEGLSISGGMFDDEPEQAYCAEGYAPADNTDAATMATYPYTVQELPDVAQIGDVKYKSLQAALDAAHEMTGNVTIELLDDISGYSIVHQKAGLNLTIDGKEFTLNGQIIIDGDGRANGTETLTIQNIKFEDDLTNFYTGTDAFVLVPSTKDSGTPYYTNKYNYAHNITISDCSFTSTAAAFKAVGFKSTSGAGCYNLVMSNVSGDNLHSLAQLTGTTGATFDNCSATQTGSFIGVNGGGGTYIVSNCTFESHPDKADGYAYREKSSSTAVATLTNNNFKAYDAIILGSAGTINIESGTYDGNVSKTNGTIAISGGYFSEEFPDEYIAAELVAEGNSCVPATDKPGYFTVGIPHYVAQIGEGENAVKYTTLAAAVDAVPDDGTETTIVMIDDETINTNAGVTIPANKNIVLDLNGKTVKGVVQSPASAQTILNKGTLTITDSSDDKNGTITNEVSDDNAGSPGNGKNWFSNAITNNGTLTVNAGNIVNTGTGGACYAIDNITNGTTCTAVLNIAGGNISANKVAIRMFCNSTTNDNTVNVTGGVISGGYGGIQTMMANNNANKAKLTISGGTLSGEYAWYDYGNGDVATQFDNASYSITGGFFSGYMWSYATYYCGMEGFVSGGYFSNEIGGDLVAPGSACVENTDAATMAAYPYTIGQADIYYYWLDNNNQIDGGGYYTIYAPFAGTDVALMDGEFVTLLRNVTLTKDITYIEELPSSWNADPIFKGGTFTLTFGEYNINLNGHVFPIPTGVTILTDKQTNIFSALEEGFAVVEEATETGYAYSVKKSIASPSITIIVDPATYNGTAQTPVVTVKDGTTELVQGTDYTISYKGGDTNSHLVNADTYVEEIVITGMGNYGGTRYADFIILPLNLTDYVVSATAPYVAAGYGDDNNGSGAAVKEAATITIKNGSNEPLSAEVLAKLDITIDNDPTAANNYNNTGTYEGVVHVTPKVDNSDPDNVIDYGQNFTGSIVPGNLVIGDGIDITNSLVVTTPNVIYTGAALPPSADNMIVKVGENVLTYETDYTFTFNGVAGDYINAKTYQNAITITGLGAYEGTFKTDYVIAPRDLSDEGITVTTTNLSYLNTEQAVTVEVKYGDNVIPATNYTYTPNKVTEAGKHIITINAVENSNLVGSTTVVQWVFKSLEGDYAADFTVEPDPIPTQNWTGSEIKPTIIVKDKDRVLQLVDANDGDYSIEYSDNIDEGEATITITGRYAYSGSITKHFTIVSAYFTENGITYHHANEGEEVTVGNTGKTLAVDTEVIGNPVTVPTTVEHGGKSFTVIGVEQNAFGSDAITGIVLPESIAEVENGAFSGADNLHYVDLSTATGFTPSSLQRNIAASPFNGVPKQALVFLNGTTFTGENYVYNPGSGNQYYCEVFKIYDDLSGAQTGFGGNDYKWAFENPHEFTAYSVENTRQLTAERHYTICLPYALEIPNNVKAYTLEATSDKLFGFTEVTGTLAAYTPYVLIPTKSGQLLGTNNNTVVPAFPATADTDATKLNDTPAGSFTMYGTMRYMEGDAAQGKYIMQYNNGNPTWKKITETSAGFEASNKACILPMRAYIMDNTGGSREFFDVVFTNIDGTTLTFDKLRFDDDTIYDLSGRKVELLERGHTYIINGKKVMVK